MVGRFCLVFTPLLAAIWGTGCTVSQGQDSPSPTTENPPTNGAEPATVTIRRLNRVEYDNTVRDLLGSSLRPGESFPPENLDHGFDVIGEALTVQPLHIELYEQAAQALTAELFARPVGDPIRDAILNCDYSAGDPNCTAGILSGFAQRAWRRPLAAGEIDPILAIQAQGSTPEEGLGLAFQVILLSPHFIYRAELDPTVDSPEVHPLSDYELASRLSYFLWSSMPDDALFAAASEGRLQSAEELLAQVDRMLADPRSSALVDNFAGQWLNLRRVDQVQPDYEAFPEFDDELRASMRAESEALFNDLLRSGAPASDILSAPFTYLNDRLANHYGLPAPGSTELVRVDLAGQLRQGFLTHGSFLTLTSNPTRTSPVKRGKWVLDQMLCEAPPPPPPGVEADLDAVGTEEQSIRERLELHRSDPACAACHLVMDAIGLSFENFDGIGAYREYDGASPVDASGTLDRNGESIPFNGPGELSAILSADTRFNTCLSEKFLTYALGAPIGRNDTALVAAVAEDAATRGGSMRAMIESVVLSSAFRSRRAN